MSNGANKQRISCNDGVINNKTIPSINEISAACQPCTCLSGKPPLPVQKKKRISRKLSPSAKLVLEKARKRRAATTLATTPIMGQSCTKKIRVVENGILSPKTKSNKVKPSPFKTNTIATNHTESHLTLPTSNCPSRLSMNEISFQSPGIMAIPEENYDAAFDKEDGRDDTRMEKTTTPYSMQNEQKTPIPQHDNNNKSINPDSTESSVASTPDNGSPVQDIHGSAPNLRSTFSPCKKQSRSSSHGDFQLKKSFGSADLLNKAVLKPNSGVLQPRHRHSVESVTFEKRRRKIPTKENGIHNLDGDQVNYYHIHDEIGRGSFGAIYKCHCSKDNKYYAMKIISKKRLMRKNGLLGRQPGKKRNPLEPLHREIAILKKMDHPNIVKLVEVMDDLQVDNVYMVFELMKNGVVIEIPTEKTIPEERARRLFRELLLGTEYLHYSKIIHRDIKPSNLLLDDDDHIKIADFGVSDMFEGDNDLLNRYAGSPAFQAPESLNHDLRDKYSGKAVDVWAMGITLFCFLYGKCPFYSDNMGDIELLNIIKNDPLQFPDEPSVNPQAQDLISRMLSKDPKERITISEMKEHHWVTDGGCTILPTTEEHCRVIEVTDEEVRNSVKIISKLTSLVFAKSIVKKGRWWKRHSMPTTTPT